jgi:hypothetical protein
MAPTMHGPACEAVWTWCSEISGDSIGTAAGLVDLSNDGFRFLRTASVMDEHLGAGLGERQCAGAPDAARGAMRDPLLPDLGGEHRAKLVPPKLDRIMADIDPALGQEILDVG